MAVNYVTSSRSNYAPGRNPEEEEVGSGGLFGWVIAIIVLLGIDIVAWMFPIYVFGHPETAFNYNLLTKLDKLAPIEEFPYHAAPSGKFQDARSLYKHYYNTDDRQLTALNSILKKNYIENYTKAEEVLYIKGKFRIYQVRRLTEEDVFTSGLVIRAESVTYPNVVVEHIFPAPEDAIPEENFNVNDEIEIKGNTSFASALHIERLPNERMCFSLVPLIYGDYQFDKGGETLKLSPPKRLNMEGRWPITDEAIGGGAE